MLHKLEIGRQGDPLKPVKQSGRKQKKQLSRKAGL